MAIFSRRQLAIYAVNELLAKKTPARISEHLAAALIESKKTKEADLLLDDIAEELEARGLLALAVVTTVDGLSAGLQKTLAEQIKKAARVNEVSLSEKIDKRVIGGVRVETKRHTWDQTVQHKLAEIKGGING